MDYEALEKIVEFALDEDLSLGCDITTENTLPRDLVVSFEVNARKETVVCVEPLAKVIFAQSGIEYFLNKEDGDRVLPGECIIRGCCSARLLLRIERVFLNFIQRSCAVAAATKQFVNAVSHTKVKIRDTRKTTPGMRCVERYAVKVGGGESYRNSLNDMVLLKDNHIAICGSMTAAVCNLKESLGDVYITAECDTFDQVKEALSVDVDSILLDNMSVKEIVDCVRYIRNASPRVKIDASGGVTLATVKEIAETGVDFISVGMLTHSIISADIGIDIKARL
ncbi:carboxylating nicotinate-nucleotide diphosphorylase [Neorickettsia sp. 179522]|uniref:carboxylating nicotinate-nucleotide diphosphorylase n=1 Tax=Neorickettsia sp. 179522 TaxID=1714371 RepID=UPI00079BE088|nr:carboxylating nicotinate-nucleotide diphosphorylase [Neorickettsia sp. 179522]KYH12286.1 nicotinate-nucleotide pyrophosphorylase [Neorickettsia sp. 179522]